MLTFPQPFGQTVHLQLQGWTVYWFTLRICLKRILWDFGEHFRMNSRDLTDACKYNMWPLIAITGQKMTKSKLGLLVGTHKLTTMQFRHNTFAVEISCGDGSRPLTNKKPRYIDWKDFRPFTLQFLNDGWMRHQWMRLKMLSMTRWGIGGLNEQLEQMQLGTVVWCQTGFNACRGVSSFTSLEHASVVQFCNGSMTKPQGNWHRHGKFHGLNLQFTGCSTMLQRFQCPIWKEDGETLPPMTTLKQWQRRWWFSVAFSVSWVSFAMTLPSCVLGCHWPCFEFTLPNLGWLCT